MENTTGTKSTVTLFDRANSQLQKRIFQHSHHWPICVDNVIDNALHFVVWHLCMAAYNVSCLSHHYHLCWNTPPTVSLFSHPLFGLQKHSASIDECQWLFFPHGKYYFISSFLFCQVISQSASRDHPSLLPNCTVNLTPTEHRLTPLCMPIHIDI